MEQGRAGRVNQGRAGRNGMKEESKAKQKFDRGREPLYAHQITQKNYVNRNVHLYNKDVIRVSQTSIIPV